MRHQRTAVARAAALVSTISTVACASARPRSVACYVLAAAFPLGVAAQGVATEAQLAPISVSEARSNLAPDLPSSTASKTAEQLREQNIVNPEDVANYLPSTTIRKRYLGDRNANVGGRSFGVLQPGRALVYLDGYLISNFLGRFDARITGWDPRRKPTRRSRCSSRRSRSILSTGEHMPPSRRRPGGSSNPPGSQLPRADTSAHSTACRRLSPRR